MEESTYINRFTFSRSPVPSTAYNWIGSSKARRFTENCSIDWLEGHYFISESLNKSSTETSRI